MIIQPHKVKTVHVFHNYNPHSMHRTTKLKHLTGSMLAFVSTCSSSDCHLTILTLIDLIKMHNEVL